jgi:phosphohistidine phosphatase
MHLYLIRHAHAVDAEEDSSRPLSARGIGQVNALAKFLKSSGAFAPEEIWHSPLARSRETAERLTRRLKLDVPLTLRSGLEPEDNPEAVAAQLKDCAQAVAIIGHEPQLSAVASLLVAGRAAPAKFTLKKGAALALEGIGPHWSVRWLLAPELLA